MIPANSVVLKSWTTISEGKAQLMYEAGFTVALDTTTGKWYSTAKYIRRFDEKEGRKIERILA